jgi:hypothetical protein
LALATGMTFMTLFRIRFNGAESSGRSKVSIGFAGEAPTPRRDDGTTLLSAAEKSPRPRVSRDVSSSNRDVDSYTCRVSI